MTHVHDGAASRPLPGLGQSSLTPASLLAAGGCKTDCALSRSTLPVNMVALALTTVGWPWDLFCARPSCNVTTDCCRLRDDDAGHLGASVGGGIRKL